MRAGKAIRNIGCGAVAGWLGAMFALAQTAPKDTTIQGGQQQPKAAKPAAAQPAPSDQKAPAKPAPTAEKTTAKQETRAQPTAPSEEFGYRGVSSFFNIREAYSNVKKGEWAFEVGSFWFTRSGERDEIELSQSLKYGFTDDLHIEIEVAEPLGTGGEGVGETQLTIFNTFLHEDVILPAFGLSLAGRFPSGYESSGVDGTLTGMLTKTLAPRFRGHLMGYVRTANGAPGNEDYSDRRDFQWGAGPGFDYQLGDDTLVVLNYLNKVSDEYGGHNNNVLELGLVHEFATSGQFHHGIKLAADIGLDGQDETPHAGAKLLWEIDW